MAEKDGKYVLSLAIAPDQSEPIIISKPPKNINRFGAYACVAHLDDGDYQFLVSVDYAKLKPKQRQRFRKHVAGFWGITPTQNDFEGTRYFLVHAMWRSGVSTPLFYLPLQKLVTP